MITIFVCLLQITIIGVVSSAASRLSLQKAPQLAARISWLGIVLSALVVVVNYCDAPRLWTVQATSQQTREAQSTPAIAPKGTVSINGNSAAATPALPLQLTAQELLFAISRFQNQNPTTEARLVNGCTLFACIFSLAILGRCVAGGCWMWRLRRARSFADDSVVQKETAALASDCGISFPVRICKSEFLSSPCVSWLSRGTIYVPCDFETWKPEERRTALAHELTHEVRRDPQYRLVAELCVSLIFCHPIVLLLRRQLVFAQELATDRQAAKVLGSKTSYQRGLSLLALRMDSQRTAACLVSVSTHDVIRRIQMLKFTKPSLSRWQEVVSVTAILIVCGLAAAWTVNADDPIRARTVSKSEIIGTTHPEKAQDILPWKELGKQDGYIVLQPSILSQHPVLRFGYESYIAETFSHDDLDTAGLAPENIKSMQLPLIINLSATPENSRANNDGHKHQLSFGIDAIVIATKQPVSWPDVGEKYYPYMAPKQISWLRSQLKAFGQSSNARVLSKSATDRKSNHFRKVEATWNMVSDCPVAIASATPKDLELHFEEQSDTIDARLLFAAIEATAVGIDLSSEVGIPTVRLAFAPKDGRSSSEVMSLIKLTRAKAVNAAGAFVSLGSVNEVQQVVLTQLIDDLAASQLKVAPTKNGTEVIVATIPITGDLSALIP